MKLVWSAASRRHLREARDHIAQDNPDAADALVAVIEDRARTLHMFPAAGREDALGRRLLALPPTPYSLIYRILPDRVFVIAVWHGARQWPPARD